MNRIEPFVKRWGESDVDDWINGELNFEIKKHFTGKSVYSFCRIDADDKRKCYVFHFARPVRLPDQIPIFISSDETFCCWSSPRASVGFIDFNSDMVASEVSELLSTWSTQRSDAIHLYGCRSPARFKTFESKYHIEHRVEYLPDNSRLDHVLASRQRSGKSSRKTHCDPVAPPKTTVVDLLAIRTPEPLDHTGNLRARAESDESSVSDSCDETFMDHISASRLAAKSLFNIYKSLNDDSARQMIVREIIELFPKRRRVCRNSF